ncbi:hypothetical protein QNI22_16225 [Cytophagaceae bacterium BD1B2-1]|uniref:Uncharacterized protein n=2 Tax=Xanthocytophaga agilis TaxID=3048010 RepID=A0AAE3R1W1_9BACT|nr:hypothetical protein [Xanthocytophaga agilis]
MSLYLSMEQNKIKLLTADNLTIIEVIFDPIYPLPALYTVVVAREDNDYVLNEAGMIIFIGI